MVLKRPNCVSPFVRRTSTGGSAVAAGGRAGVEVCPDAGKAGEERVPSVCAQQKMEVSLAPTGAARSSGRKRKMSISSSSSRGEDGKASSNPSSRRRVTEEGEGPSSPLPSSVGDDDGGGLVSPVPSAAAAAAAAVSGVEPKEETLAKLNPLMEHMPTTVHPEVFLHGILRERGYETTVVSTLDCPRFHQEPSVASVEGYNMEIVQAVRDNDVSKLLAMQAAGHKLLVCNKFGESIMHMSCRRGNADTLSLLISNGAEVTISDDFGRTPLHDAFWASEPSVDVVSMLLRLDLRLLRLRDRRGYTPLQYVRPQHWQLWNAFFFLRKDEFWSYLTAGEKDPAGGLGMEVELGKGKGEGAATMAIA